MGYGVFEIGLRHERTNSFRITVFETTGLFAALAWLKHANARDHHIYIRPAHPHGLILIDDLAPCSLPTLKRDGLEPAAVIETSPGNYQAWIKLLPVPLGLPHPLATHIAKLLASRYRGDSGSADWRHFGRLAGFTNRKPPYRDSRGYHPYVLIHEWPGHMATMASALLNEAHHSLIVPKEAPAPANPNAVCETVSPNPGTRPLLSPQELYQRVRDQIFSRCRGAPWIANPDWSRMDFMIAQNLQREGHTFQEIWQALLLGSPALAKRKADHSEDYLHLTLAKALGEPT
jgi:hypothetical protein